MTHMRVCGVLAFASGAVRVPRLALPHRGAPVPSMVIGLPGNSGAATLSTPTSVYAQTV